MKFEYRTESFKDHGDLDAHLDALGAEGWELVNQDTVNSWKICQFKREVSSDPVGGGSLDTLSNLINLFSDAKRVQDNIKALKDAYAEHVSAFDKLQVTQDGLTQKSAALDKAQAEINADYKNLADIRAQIDAERAHLADESGKFQSEKARHAQDIAEQIKMIDKANEDLTNAQKIKDNDVQKRHSELDKKETLLKAREKDLDAREAAIAEKQAQNEKITQQAESFLTFIKNK